MYVLHTQSPLHSTALCHQETRTSIRFLHQMYYVLAATSSVTLSTFPNIFSWMASLGAPNLREQDLGCVVGVEDQFIWICASSVVKLVCGCALSCWRRIHQHLCEAELSWNASARFQEFEYTDGLTTWHNVLTKSPLLHRKNIVASMMRYTELSLAFSRSCSSWSQTITVP